jgi:hypothetical protein
LHELVTREPFPQGYEESVANRRTRETFEAPGYEKVTVGKKSRHSRKILAPDQSSEGVTSTTLKKAVSVVFAENVQELRHGRMSH